MIASAVCASVGLLLIRSAVVKLRAPEAFWRILQQYPGTRVFGTAAAARIVPFTEAAGGAILVGGSLTGARVSLLPALVFLCAASVAVLSRYVRGERRFACGCNRHLGEETQAVAVLLRNCVLLLVLACAATALAPSTWHAWMLALALLLAHDMFDAALGHELRIRAWKAQP